MKVLVTGGAGFTGSNFIRYMLKQDSEVQIVNLDKLTYAGNLANLQDVAHDSRYHFVKGDICNREAVEEVAAAGFDAVINFAAESHVDRSIQDPGAFVETNVLGTQVLLEAFRRRNLSMFVQISTDEVYGSLGPTGSFTEESPLAPNSPYAASKAGAELVVRAYHQTYRMPAVITRSSNNYGPYQFPEKLIPLTITNALEGKPVPVYGDGQQRRDWVHVEDHSRAIAMLLQKGRAGETYNIASNTEVSNIQIVRTITTKLEYMLGLREGTLTSLVTYVKDRPGHDRRYAMDTSKIRNELSWAPLYDLEKGLGETIRWYVENRGWWERLKKGEFLEYYARNYLGR